jgi:DNA-binding MarR family transcriptional regulator
VTTSAAPATSAAALSASPESPGTLDTSVAGLAARMRLAVARLHRRARKEGIRRGDDLTASRLAALASIEKLGPLTLGELAAEEQVQPPSMTRIVARLEEQGLVVRTVDPDDRRVARVAVTRAGTSLLNVTRTRRNAFLAQRVARFTDEERATLAAALPLLERILEDD